MAHLADYDTENKYKAAILKTDRLTPLDTEEVREIMLEVKDPDFACEVDQSFGVRSKRQMSLETNSITAYTVSPTCLLKRMESRTSHF